MKPPKYQTAVMEHGTLFWRIEDSIAWSVFIRPEGLITQAMAAALLGKSLTTVNTWVRTGRLKSASKVPGRPSMIPLCEVLAARPVIPIRQAQLTLFKRHPRFGP